MEEDKIKESKDYLETLLALVPDNLKAGEDIDTECPFCKSKLSISRSALNGHLWIVCEKEGPLIIQ